MNKEYCPQCVVEMKKESKKLGSFSVWMVCPNCGLRKRPQTESSVNHYLSKREIDRQEQIKRQIQLEDSELGIIY